MFNGVYSCVFTNGGAKDICGLEETCTQEM